nr:MAG TPA: hypothetical protein [Caudoviricetes sp.]
MTETKIAELKNAIRDGKLVQTAGGIRQERVQSDKLGFDWVNFYVNDLLVRQDYVAQEHPVGTADNPFAWHAELTLISNAYYYYAGERKVWTGEAGVTAAWDDPGFVVM